MSWLGREIRDASDKLKSVTHSDKKSSVEASLTKFLKLNHIFRILINGGGSQTLELGCIESTSSLSTLQRIVPSSTMLV